MANNKWSGIESSKYGLTARWYVSAYYGNDVDVDGAGYYNLSTNVTGHGGPTRPFATINKLIQDSNVAANAVCVVDGGYYVYSVSGKILTLVGDGHVVVTNNKTTTNLMSAYNVVFINWGTSPNNNASWTDCCFYYCQATSYAGNIDRCLFVECIMGSGHSGNPSYCRNSLFYRSSNIIGITSTITPSVNNFFIDCANLTITGLSKPRVVGFVFDYNAIIGTVKVNGITINSKTSSVTIEDFKADGNFNVKGISEVDLFGNATGSGASIVQLQTIFNNFFSPVYVDTWPFLDLSLKPSASEKIRFGGMNGAYIGMRPVGYHLSAATLWANRNVSNTSNVEIDAVTGYLQIVTGAEYGTLETNEIDLGTPIIVDPVLFRANLVYNADGTAKQGVANQRIDTTIDLLPNNTLNQRVVYDYQMAYAADGVSALSAFKNFELNRKPTVDAELDSQLDDNYNSAAAQSITVRRFKLRVVLRKIVID